MTDELEGLLAKGERAAFHGRPGDGVGPLRRAVEMAHAQGRDDEATAATWLLGVNLGASGRYGSALAALAPLLDDPGDVPTRRAVRLAGGVDVGQRAPPARPAPGRPGAGRARPGAGRRGRGGDVRRAPRPGGGRRGARRRRHRPCRAGHCGHPGRGPGGLVAAAGAAQLGALRDRPARCGRRRGDRRGREGGGAGRGVGRTEARGQGAAVPRRLAAAGRPGGRGGRDAAAGGHPRGEPGLPAAAVAVPGDARRDARGGQLGEGRQAPVRRAQRRLSRSPRTCPRTSGRAGWAGPTSARCSRADEPEIIKGSPSGRIVPKYPS